MSNKPVGWRKQPARHALAAKGVKTKQLRGTQAFIRGNKDAPFDAFWNYRRPDTPSTYRRDFWWFHDVPASVAKAFMTKHPKILNPTDQQNISPEMREMIEIAEKYDGTVFGYAVPPESGRNDVRISLEGFTIKADELTARRLQNEVRADEFDRGDKKGTWRFWWD